VDPACIILAFVWQDYLANNSIGTGKLIRERYNDLEKQNVDGKTWANNTVCEL
jgi:hypothetical protein